MTRGRCHAHCLCVSSKTLIFILHYYSFRGSCLLGLKQKISSVLVYVYFSISKGNISLPAECLEKPCKSNFKVQIQTGVISLLWRSLQCKFNPEKTLIQSSRAQLESIWQNQDNLDNSSCYKLMGQGFLAYSVMFVLFSAIFFIALCVLHRLHNRHSLPILCKGQQVYQNSSIRCT